MNIDRETADKYQGLFNYLNDQYGINPTIEGMNDLISEVDKTKQLLIPRVTKRTFKCLGCKHYKVKVINEKGGTAKTCNVNNNDVRIIVDLDAPNCKNYQYAW